MGITIVQYFITLLWNIPSVNRCTVWACVHVFMHGQVEVQLYKSGTLKWTADLVPVYMHEKGNQLIFQSASNTATLGGDMASSSLLVWDSSPVGLFHQRPNK